MVARSVRERVAVALLAGSVVVASVLGVMTILTFTQGGVGAIGPSGDVAGSTASVPGGGNQAANLLQQFANPNAQLPTSPRTDRIRVVADPNSNLLLVRASPLDLITIRNLLDTDEQHEFAHAIGLLSRIANA